MSLKVAIYAIAHNEEERAAEWAQHIRKELYPGDNVIVADVGSTDNTFREFQKAGVLPKRIYVRPFRFDIARNTALSLVPPDIDCCICLDIDERLATGWRDELEKAWSLHGNYSIIQYQYAPGIVFADGRRVHSRFGWRWRYPAHEGLYSYGITGIQTSEIIIKPFIVHHQNTSKDRTQYLGMLQVGIDENPTSRRMHHYYGRELFYRGAYRKALDYLQKYYDLKPEYENPWEEEQHKLFYDAAKVHCKVATLQHRDES